MPLRQWHENLQKKKIVVNILFTIPINVVKLILCFLQIYKFKFKFKMQLHFTGYHNF